MDKEFKPPRFFWPLRWCPLACGIRWHKWRRLNTLYYDDRTNWMFSSQEAFEERWEYYAERWADYYSSRF